MAGSATSARQSPVERLKPNACARAAASSGVTSATISRTSLPRRLNTVGAWA